MANGLIDAAKHKQLFLDDYAIETMDGLVRTLHPVDKQGPVIEPDESIGQLAVQSSSPPLWNPDRGLYEWWFNARYSTPPRPPRMGTTVTRGHYATSTDGLTWDRPSLGLHEWEGSRDNNLAREPGKIGLTHILRDEREPAPARRYKGMFGGGHREFGVSPDGFDWTMLDVPGIPSQDTSYMLYDEYTEQFLAYHKLSTEWGRSVWLAKCTEFGDWSESVLVFHSDEQDRENAARRIQAVVDDPDYLTPPIIDEQDYIAQIYKMSVMPYEGLYVGFPVLYNPSGLIPPPRGNATGISQVELTVSRDLYNWDRVADREIFIPLDKWDGVNYGTCQILTCGRPLVRDDGEIWVYYSACRARGHKQLYWYSPRVQPHRPVVLQRLGRERHRAIPGEGAAAGLRLAGRAGRGLADDQAVRNGRQGPSRQRRRIRRAPRGAPGRRHDGAAGRLHSRRVRRGVGRPRERRGDVGRPDGAGGPHSGAGQLHAARRRPLRLLGGVVADSPFSHARNGAAPRKLCGVGYPTARTGRPLRGEAAPANAPLPRSRRGQWGVREQRGVGCRN